MHVLSSSPFFLHVNSHTSSQFHIFHIFFSTISKILHGTILINPTFTWGKRALDSVSFTLLDNPAVVFSAVLYVAGVPWQQHLSLSFHPNPLPSLSVSLPQSLSYIAHSTQLFIQHEVCSTLPHFWPANHLSDTVVVLWDFFIYVGHTFIVHHKERFFSLEYKFEMSLC